MTRPRVPVKDPAAARRQKAYRARLRAGEASVWVPVPVAIINMLIVERRITVTEAGNRAAIAAAIGRLLAERAKAHGL